MSIDAKRLFDQIRIIAGRPLTQGEVDAVNDIIGVTDPSIRRLSANGLNLIKVSEGLMLKAYRDAVNVLTIGYGHTGADVTPGLVVTEAQAEALLLGDVARFEAAVRRLCPLTTQGQFDALTSFAFNLGEKALEDSTLRRLHNEGKYGEASEQFKKWVHAGGRVLAGLVKRRAAEAALYRKIV